MKEKPKIFCWINGKYGENFAVLAMAEDGKILAQHVSSTKEYGLHDIGINSDWKHDKYRKYYPDGYELVWVEDCENHQGLQQAYSKIQAKLKKEVLEVVIRDFDKCYSTLKSDLWKHGRFYDNIEFFETVSVMVDHIRGQCDKPENHKIEKLTITIQREPITIEELTPKANK